MPKYVRTIPGAPYTKPHFITKGFEEGVGYFKNFLKHNPIFLVYSGIYVAATAGIIYRTYTWYAQPADEAYKYKNKYTVFRREDLAHPDKDCYN